MGKTEKHGWIFGISAGTVAVCLIAVLVGTSLADAEKTAGLQTAMQEQEKSYVQAMAQVHASAEAEVSDLIARQTEESQNIADLQTRLQQAEKEASAAKTELEQAKAQLASAKQQASQLLTQRQALENQLSIYQLQQGTKLAAKTGSKEVYLTFDDGPSSNTPVLLDLLKQYNVKATFFVVGSNTDFAKKMYKRIVTEGHTLGMHAYDHTYSSLYRTKESYFADQKKLDALIYSATGIHPVVCRFPGGSNNTVNPHTDHIGFMRSLCDQLVQNGTCYFDWNVSSGDASGYRMSENYIYNNVIKGVGGQKRSVVLCHDAAPKTTTVSAMRKAIPELLAKGYHFYPLAPTDCPLTRFVAPSK